MISIVIPMYNESNSILRSLKEMRKLNLQGCEIIYVDGNSPDGTYELLKQRIDELQLRNINVVKNPNTPGTRSSNMNFGASIANGDLYLFLHSDCYISQDALDWLRYVSIDKNVQAGGFKLEFRSSKWTFRGIEIYSNTRAKFFEMYHGDQGMFMSRVAFERVGGFDDVPLMEDVSMSQKLRNVYNLIQSPYTLSVSPRRIDQNGFLRMVLLYFYMKGSYYLGTSPKKLAQIYNRLKSR